MDSLDLQLAEEEEGQGQRATGEVSRARRGAITSLLPKGVNGAEAAPNCGGRCPPAVRPEGRWKMGLFKEHRVAFTRLFYKQPPGVPAMKILPPQRASCLTPNVPAGLCLEDTLPERQAPKPCRW